MKTIVKAFTLLLFAAASLQAQVPSRLADTTAKIQADIWVARFRKNVKLIRGSKLINKASSEFKAGPAGFYAEYVYIPDTDELFLGGSFAGESITGSLYVDYDEISGAISFIEWAKTFNIRGGERLVYNFRGGTDITITNSGIMFEAGVNFPFEKFADVVIENFKNALAWLDEQKALLKK